MSAPRNSRSVGDKRFYDHRGQSVPSVTTILSAINKPALLTWYAKMAAGEAIETLREAGDFAGFMAVLAERQWEAHEATATHRTRHQRKCDFEADALGWLAGAPTRTRDTAGRRGTAVHEAAEADADLDDVPEHAQKAYGSYHQWLADFDPIILVKEGQVFNAEVGYAGSFDLIAAINDSVYLLDIKTSKSVYQETRLQLAAYRYGVVCVIDDEIDVAGTNALSVIERTAILHLTDSGYTLWDVEAGEAEFAVFRNVLRTWNFLAASDKQDVGVVIQATTEAAA